MTIRNTIDHLKHVAQQEGITFEEQALAVIAEKADGGMRDALSIFDQAASFCQGNITYEKVIEDLNVLDSENYFKIIDLSIENKVSDIMVLLNSVINKGFDGGLLIQGLAKHVRNVLMARDPQTLPLLEVSDQMRERYQEQAKRCQIPFLYDALKLMNQCDINYRQSSNKRLLVELTLIEIAQITQPAEDGVSAGRKPRRLKSLFRTLIQQSKPKTTAPQVAAAAPVISPKKQAEPAKASNTSIYSTTNQANTTSTASKPNLSLDGIGFSWSKLNNKGEKSTKGGMQIIPGSINLPTGKEKQTDAQFTQTDLEYQWMSMCNRMPQKYSGIATRMKNMNPTITEFPAVEVVVDNGLIKQELEDIQGSISKTLQIYLHNNDLKLSIRVAEQKEKMKILSRREQYDQMAEKNPAVKKLQQVFDLELA
jgi:DNA polymerase-3 subunit gamma/tau